MLIFEAPTRELATRFLRGDRDVSLDQAGPLFARWSRSVALGVSADAAAYPVGTTDADLATRRDRLAQVLREKASLLGPISDRLAARSLVAVVADPEGVILASQGGGAAEDPALRVRLVAGAQWSENARGTNAIGTAITEQKAVAVIGAAHFEVRNHGIFCYARPVFDAYGEMIAVLDVTGPLEQHSRDVGHAVQGAASSLEQALRDLAYAQSGAGGGAGRGGTLAAIERLVQRSSSATLLVEANGRIATLNDQARDVLGVSSLSTLTCERTFGLGFPELRRLAVEGPAELRFEMASAELRVELDPVGDPGGKICAIVVHLEGSRAPRTVRQPHEPPSSSRSPSRAPAFTPSPAASTLVASAVSAVQSSPRSSSRMPAAAAPSPTHASFAPIFGTDPALVAAKEAATRFAATDLPVLLLAETGTGKELFARAIHGSSARGAGPFVALNCGALASGVLESELFGHAPNSFTGASRHGVDGKIAAANGGTLFLDEIAEMPDTVQAALLRVLDHGGAHYRVGDTRPRHSDFRLVCATCRDLPALVERGAFRRDLFFRIHGACVTLPALRERCDRIELAEHLLARVLPRVPSSSGHAGEPVETDPSASALEWIAQHDWPGNIRELRSALVHAVAMADGQAITADHFPRVLVGLSSSRASSHAQEPPRQEEVAEARTRVAILEQAIQDALRASAGNVSEAARRLGIARSTVYRAIRSRMS